MKLLLECFFIPGYFHLLNTLWWISFYLAVFHINVVTHQSYLFGPVCGASCPGVPWPRCPVGLTWDINSHYKGKMMEMQRQVITFHAEMICVDDVRDTGQLDQQRAVSVWWMCVFEVKTRHLRQFLDHLQSVKIGNNHVLNIVCVNLIM